VGQEGDHVKKTTIGNPTGRKMGIHLPIGFPTVLAIHSVGPLRTVDAAFPSEVGEHYPQEETSQPAITHGNDTWSLPSQVTQQRQDRTDVLIAGRQRWHTVTQRPIASSHQCGGVFEVFIL
jgi:hypothetical protein